MNPQQPYAPLSDPAGPPALVAAAGWVQQALLGSVATAIAVLAIGSIGFLMLQGRVELRRGATVIIGCFVLFGAPAISAGLLALVRGEAGSRVAEPPPPPAPPPPVTTPPAPYDPYAGAAVPVR